MRILEISHYFDSERGGGIAHVVIPFTKQLRERGHTVTWMAAGEMPGDLPFRCLSLPSWNLFYRWWSIPYPILKWSAITSLWREMKSYGLIHLHDETYTMCLAAKIMASLLGKPVVITQHIGFIPYRRLVPRWAMRLLTWFSGWLSLQQADAVIFESRTVEREFRPWCSLPQLTEFIPNGANLKIFRPIAFDEKMRLRREHLLPEEKFIVLFVGRFVWKKGIHYMKAVAQNFPEVLFLFVGGGDSDPGEWQLPNVHLLGRRSFSKMPACYQLSDLLILPACGEGIPQVVQEAVACGIPALASRDIIEGMPGLADICFAAEPNEQAFKTELARILNEQLCENVAARCRTFAEQQWKADIWMERHIAVFEKAAKSLFEK